ncbi:hypothetical protein D3C80_1203940 [compost metagenome]
MRQDEITEHRRQHRNDADHPVDHGERHRQPRLAQHIPQHGKGHDIERPRPDPLPESAEIELADPRRIGRHQGGNDKDKRAPQHHPAPAMAIRNDPPQQHSGRHAEQVDGEGGVDLRLARLQGIGNLGHGHQIEIDPDRVEDDHQESAQQENAHGCSIAKGPPTQTMPTSVGGGSRGDRLNMGSTIGGAPART